MSKVALGPTQWLLWAVSVKCTAEHLLPSRDKVKLYIHCTLCSHYYTSVQKVLRYYFKIRGTYLCQVLVYCTNQMRNIKYM